MSGMTELRTTGKRPKKTKLFQVREPSGRLSRAEDEDEAAPVKVKRLRDAALAGMADAEWGTELGRLFLALKISAPMFVAGKRWGERAARYHEALNAPAPHPRAVSLEAGSHAKPPDPDSERGRLQATGDQAAVREFLAAHAALLGAGKLSEQVVRSCCERDIAPVGQHELDRLRVGLAWLSEHWGLTKRQQ